MNHEQIVAKATTIICEQLGIMETEVKPETRFVEDLGCDSLDVVEIVMEAEEVFAVSIPDEDAEKMTTVGAFLDWLKERVA